MASKEMLVLLTAVLWRAEIATADTYNCYANISVTTSCVVNYMSSLTLLCPDSTNSSSAGEWWRENSVTGGLNAVCHERNCTIDEPLHNENSGLYFCQMPDKPRYYVNVTVLAPPSIVCDPHYCTCHERTKTCFQPMIAKPFNEDISITVKFKGQGPLGVVWEHHGKQLNCSSDSSSDIRCSITRRKTHTYEYETLSLPAPHLNVSLVDGIYTANVSNPYGYNLTKEYVQIICPTVEPPQQSSNHTASLVKGDTQQITLSTRGSSDFYMWICFTTDPSINMWNIDLNSSCVSCPYDMKGNCSNLPNRPHWMVSRNETGCPGNSLLQLSVWIQDFNERDSGRLMLSWSTDASDASPNKHQVLTVTSLHYSSTDGESRFIYAGIGAGGLCLVIVVSVVTVVGGVVVHKRRKGATRRARRRAQRRYEVRNGGGGPRVAVATTTEAEVSDNDNDEQHLVRGGNGASVPDYGAIARQGYGHCSINNDTTASEIENEVVLPTESDDMTGDI